MSIIKKVALYSDDIPADWLRILTGAPEDVPVHSRVDEINRTQHRRNRHAAELSAQPCLPSPITYRRVANG